MPPLFRPPEDAIVPPGRPALAQPLPDAGPTPPTSPATIRKPSVRTVVVVLPPVEPVVRITVSGGTRPRLRPHQRVRSASACDHHHVLPAKV